MGNATADTPLPDNARRMLVTACYGHRFLLAGINGDDTAGPQARARGKRLRPVAGDRVIASPLPGESDWIIERIEPRDNELARPDNRGRREILAANVELMAIVTAPSPPSDFFIVDRYLAAARLMRCEALVVWNKSELGELPGECEEYRRIGYTVIETSAATATGIETLAEALAARLSIFVGQSGVGKSSLINRLGGGEVQRTATISAANREGRHTTVTAQLLKLREGISVIDSPGVRDYAPSIRDDADVAQGFREISAAADHCRFANCRHRAEPGCNVKMMVETGGIDARRYASFLRLAQLTRQLNEGRP